MQNEDWERKLKALQAQFEEKENLRERTQAQADRAMAEMGAKINVFKDPFMDRATEAEDLMAKIRALNGDEGSENLSTADRAGISPGSSAKGSSAADGSGLAD